MVILIKLLIFLREKGMAYAAKKADRIAAEGLTHVEIDGNTAVLLEVNCETDFVTKNEMFNSYLNKIGKALLDKKPATLKKH